MIKKQEMESKFAKMILNGTVKVSHKNVLKLAEQPKEVIWYLHKMAHSEKLFGHLSYRILPISGDGRD